MHPIYLLISTLYVLMLWPSYIAIKVYSLPSLTLDRLFVFVMLIYFLAAIMLNREGEKKIYSYGKLTILFSIYLFWGLISSVVAANDVVASGYSVLNDFMGGSFLALYIFMFVRSDHEITKIVFAIVFAILISNLFGVVELFKGELLFRDYLITENEYTKSALVEKTRNGMFRIRSVYSNPLVYAQVLVSSVPLSLYVISLCKNSVLRFVLIFNLIISFWLLYQTGSRAGLVLALFIPMSFYYLKLYKKIFLRSLLNVAYAIIVLAIVYVIYERAESMIYLSNNLNSRFVAGEIDASTLSNLIRMEQIRVGFEKITHKYIIGYGYGEAQKVVAPLRGVDNYYLTLLLTTGVVGLAIYVYILFYIMRRGLNNIKVYSDKVSVYLLTSFIVITLYYFILSIDKANTILFVVGSLLIVKFYMLRSQYQNNGSQTKKSFNSGAQL